VLTQLACIDDATVLINCIGLEFLEVFVHLPDGLRWFRVGVSRASHDAALLTDVRRRYSRTSRLGQARGVQKFQECMVRHVYTCVSDGEVDLLNSSHHFSMLPEVKSIKA
jgi:hypothetical protein